MQDTCLNVLVCWDLCDCWSPVQTLGYEANSDLSQADHSYHMEHVCVDLPWLQPRNACPIPLYLHIVSCIFTANDVKQIPKEERYSVDNILVC